MKQSLFLILLVLTKQSVAQINIAAESKWFHESSLLKSSFKDEFSQIDDSILGNEKCFILTPNIVNGLEIKKFNYQYGLDLFYQKSLPKHWKISIYNHLSYSNTFNSSYRASIQPKSFFEFKTIKDDLRAKCSYKPSQYFEFQLGMDQFHLGEGERSLLLSSQGVANPFLLLKTSFWKFEYLSLHQIWREANAQSFVPKANTTHYLNFNHKNKISIGIFETVVHQIKDTLYNRGYEVEYLNPVIFYRPQEYSLGSSDNVILGLNAFIHFKNVTLYGQLLLDDINIQEIKKKSQWWANKYGMQAGFKTQIKKYRHPLFIRSEFNLVSPYTFAATDQFTNYASQGIPKAHPLGSNFVESYSEISLEMNNFRFYAWMQYYIKGEDPLNQNFSYGGDIFKSYLNRPFGDYGYYLLMGEKKKNIQLGLKIERKINFLNLNLFIEPRFCYCSKAFGKKLENYFVFGINSGLFQQKRNY